MIRSATLIFLISACSSDYKVHANSDAEEGFDEAESAEEEMLEIDTGEPDEDPPAETDQPIAVCEATPDKVRPIVEDVTFIGSGSYDPNDLGITYEWTLAYRPDGSAVEMPGGAITASDRAGFTPDLAGEYIGRLVVTNTEGVRSDPCEASFDAEPAEAMWVEMFWENPGDDMDLHLLSPSGITDTDGDGVADGIETDQDCYFSNCTVSTWSEGLDWGIPGDAIDDPILDLDDISETGPENINIEMPQDGEYKVVVHDYPGSVYEPGNAVTINIYLDGVLEWTETRVISVEDSYTEFVLINTRTGEVTPL
jgi:hypothetical protein